MKKQKNKIITVILANVMLIASFGFTFIDHHCNIANYKEVSVLQLSAIENQFKMPSSCCSNEISDTNDIFKTEIKQACCEFNEKKFELSPSSIFNTIQKNVVKTDFFKKSIEDVKNSETIKQLENYYETAQDVIVKPTFNILKFLSKISTLRDNTKEDSQK